MAGFIEGVDRGQSVLFPERLDDWVGEDSLVRVVDFFVEELDLQRLGFVRSAAARTGRPGYHPAVLLKLFIYGYLNRIPSSRRLEREAGRNVEVMWLTGKLVPDHKTIADFRRDNGAGIRKVCAQFVELCRRIGTLKGDCVAIDGSKFRAVNNRDRNFTKGKIASRIAHLEADVERYITEMVRIDRQEDGEARAGKVEHLSRRYGRIRQEIARLREMDKALADAPDGQISLTDPDARAMATSARNSGLVGYNVQSAVDAETHLIVAHEVTNQGFDREQLSPMAIAAKAALAEPFADRASAWLDMMRAARALHPITRACMGFHLWSLAGLGQSGDRMEATVTAGRIAASEGRGAVFAPLAMGGAGGLRASGAPAERLVRWLDGMKTACLTAMRYMDDIEDWSARAKSATVSLSGKMPPALCRVLTEWPLVSAPMAEQLTGSSRAAVQRNLAWMEAQGLIREVTGQGRFRMWKAA